jgi:hypothetical protein
MIRRSRATDNHPFASRHWRLDPAPWRLAPIAGLGLPLATLLILIDSEIDTVGHAWELLYGKFSPAESRELARELGLSERQARTLENAIVRLRDAAGDPAPWNHGGRDRWS